MAGLLDLLTGAQAQPAKQQLGQQFGLDDDMTQKRSLRSFLRYLQVSNQTRTNPEALKASSVRCSLAAISAISKSQAC